MKDIHVLEILSRMNENIDFTKVIYRYYSLKEYLK